MDSSYNKLSSFSLELGVLVKLVKIELEIVFLFRLAQ